MDKHLPLAVSIAQAVGLTGVGRSTLYKAIQRGDLPIKKAGKRTLLLTDDLRRWIQELPTQDAPKALS
jgi:excisionase family DNA binding protein